MRIAAAVKDLDVYIEQPCVTYEECLSVRRHTNLPFILDENITSIHDLLQANKDKAADAVNLKISKLGGLSKTKQVILHVETPEPLICWICRWLKHFPRRESPLQLPILHGQCWVITSIRSCGIKLLIQCNG